MKNYNEPKYERDGAEVIKSELIQPGSNVPVFPNEPLSPYMEWERWKDAFSSTEIPGLSFLECSFSVGFYKYAVRGNRKYSSLSRSQAVISKWKINKTPKFLSDNSNDLGINNLTLVFPIYDGIGFWIGKKRREYGVINYTFEEEVAIAKASTIAAIKCIYDECNKDQQGITYICLCAPGRVFDPKNGKKLKNVLLTAGEELGLECFEMKNNTGQRNEVSHFRVLGSVLLNTEKRSMSGVSFTEGARDLVESAYPAWQKIRIVSGDKFIPLNDNY